MLEGFYELTSAVYWGSRPVAWFDEVFWLALGLFVMMAITLTALRWLPLWCVPAASIVGLFVSVFVIFAPIKHAQRFIECEQSTQIAYIEGVERDVIIKKCRTRATLDGEWSDWQWHSGTVK